MKLKLILICTTIFLCSCKFDEQRQLSLQLPANLVVTNAGSESFTVDSIYNTAKTDAGFVLNSFSLEPNKEVSIPVYSDTLVALQEKAFEVKGHCKTGSSWTSKEDSLNYAMPKELTIRFELAPCN